MKKRAVLPSIYCFSISFNSIIDLSDRKESDRVCFKCTNIIKVSMKKCIIFDMDGTLWDSSASVLAAGNEVIEKKLGIKNYLNQDIMNQVMGLEIEEIADIYFPQLNRDERLKLTLECLENENKYISKHGGILYEGVEETLEKLSQKHDLMIVTNAQDGYVEAMFAAHPLKKYFKDYETHGRTGLVKGENIKLIMRRNHYDHAYYVGDTMKDFEACEFAGIPMIYASYGFGKVEKAWKTINRFSELLDLFEGM